MGMNDPSAAAAKLAQLLQQSTSTVALTGAGISTESGIPDFRSPGGVWSKYRTVLYDEFMTDEDARREYWRQKAEAHAEFHKAKPNAGHDVLASWQSRDPAMLHGIITQNIDGLHQLAGSEDVLELHGTAREIKCQDCGACYPADPMVAQFSLSRQVPDCPNCEIGRMKHATISFGQSLPQGILERSLKWTRSAQLFLCIGSSLVVTPAADLPRAAKASGATLVIINRDQTPLDELADLVVATSIGDFLHSVSDLIGN